jgi:hypothetical protein
MERLKVRVRSLDVFPERRLAVAHVVATSARQVVGGSAAVIELRLRLTTTQESVRVIRRRARDAALDFLDVD